MYFFGIVLSITKNSYITYTPLNAGTKDTARQFRINLSNNYPPYGMSDIFICYSRQDMSSADRLTQHLQAEGWTVFIDRQTHVGRRWHQEIERQVHAAKAVVVL